jgi:hypothetical protein
MNRLNVAGISLALVPTAGGPAVGTQEPDMESLAWVVNSAVTGGFPQLADRDEAVVQGLYVVRPDHDEDLSEARRRWREWTGSEPDEDSYVVGTTFTRSQVLVPRRALQEIISALQALRQQGAAKSPTEPDDNDQQATQNQPESDLEIDTQVDEDWLRELEERAVTLATLEQDEQTQGTVATASAKRRFLLLELDEVGLLSESRFQELHQRLEQLHLPMLIAYHTAAMELNAYFRSPERKRYFPDVDAQPILHAPVSLDWFRLHVPAPEVYSPYDWLAFCESVFRMNDNYTRGEGEVYTQLGNQWYRLRWRKDDGVTPVLLSSAPL